jgi:hypothetical protein
MRLRTSRLFRSRAFPNGRSFWGCSRYPECKATHGAHPDGRPLGRPGNAEEKAARIEAHAWFDQLWRGGQRTRTEAYAWLRALPGVPDHIGEMGVDDCDRLVSAVRKQLLEDLRARHSAPPSARRDRS